MTTRNREKFVFSMHPDDFEESGLADNFEGTIQEYVFEDYEYRTNQGVVTNTGPALVLTISQDNPANEDSVRQPYGIGGRSGDWEYSADGKELIGGPKAALNKGANAAKLMAELANLGINLEGAKNAQKPEFLLGYKFRWNRRENPGVTSSRTPSADGRRNVPTILLPTVLISAPRGGRAAARSSGGAKAAVQAPAAELTDEQRDLFTAVLALQANPVKRTQLPALLATARNTDFTGPDHAALRQSTAKVSIINQAIEDGLLVEEDGAVSLAAPAE